MRAPHNGVQSLFVCELREKSWHVRDFREFDGEFPNAMPIGAINP
jgi:hypothetical protein